MYFHIFFSTIGVGVYFVIGKTRKFRSIFTKSRKLCTKNLTLGQSITNVNCPEFQNVRLLHLKYTWFLIIAKSLFLQQMFNWSNFSVVFFYKSFYQLKISLCQKIFYLCQLHKRTKPLSITLPLLPCAPTSQLLQYNISKNKWL